ncbi:MAG: nucleoside 2-deoxyribosyltransferase [Candidatus Micrarchaeaceae archaeon]|jgi:nucleoside 2-deoxyribosyltransferase
MNIYFAGSIRGGREDVGLYRKLIEHMGRYGKVLTEHLGNVNITSSGEQLAAEEIYERDVDWLNKADVMVAEISTPSLGVGYELCKAESLGIPVLCLYNGSRNEPSAMITGNKRFRISRYEDIDAAFKEIDTFLSEHKKD